jgi:hypothetical protein
MSTFDDTLTRTLEAVSSFYMTSHQSKYFSYMRLEALMMVFWVVMLYGLQGRYRHFRGTYCLHLQENESIMFPHLL